MWTALYREAKEALVDFLFPPLCLYCEQSVLQSKKLLCTHCSDLLTLMDIAARCLRCFCPSEQAECALCLKNPLLPKRAYVCEQYGPVRALLSQITSSFGEEIAKSMGSLMTVQLCRLPWTLPSVIIPLPETTRSSPALARQMASFLQIDVRDVLKKRPFSLSKEGLREEPEFYWRKRILVSDQIVLLVATKAPLEEELKKICELLHEGDPKELYLLSFTSR